VSAAPNRAANRWTCQRKVERFTRRTPSRAAQPPANPSPPGAWVASKASERPGYLARYRKVGQEPGAGSPPGWRVGQVSQALTSPHPLANSARRPRCVPQRDDHPSASTGRRCRGAYSRSPPPEVQRKPTTERRLVAGCPTHAPTATKTTFGHTAAPSVHGRKNLKPRSYNECLIAQTTHCGSVIALSTHQKSRG
jgi:hypothetical protein